MKRLRRLPASLVPALRSLEGSTAIRSVRGRDNEKRRWKEGDCKEEEEEEEADDGDDEFLTLSQNFLAHVCDVSQLLQPLRDCRRSEENNTKRRR